MFKRRHVGDPPHLVFMKDMASRGKGCIFFGSLLRTEVRSGGRRGDILGSAGLRPRKTKGVASSAEREPGTYFGLWARAIEKKGGFLPSCFLFRMQRHHFFCSYHSCHDMDFTVPFLEERNYMIEIAIMGCRFA